MIRFVHPEAFLLAIVVVVALRRRFVHGRLVTVLRGLLLLLVLALLAGPYVEGTSAGRDLILVLDRSRSAPETGLDTASEMADHAAKQARSGDRIGLVVFGRDAVVESRPTEGYRFSAPSKEVDGEGTDIASALDAALALVPPERQASILLISDGEITGRDPAAAARHALRRGIRVDAVPLRRKGAFDLAVEDVAVPEEVASGEPFQVTVWVRSDRETEAPVRIFRDGREIASGTRRFRRGLNRVRFRDVAGEPGIRMYDVRVATEGDRIAENDRARAAVRIGGPFRVLCVTPSGREDRLSRSLAASGIRVVVAAPKHAPLTDAALDGFRAVVLENVALPDLPVSAAAALGRYVRDLGGGLLMTGGRASFGPGGYHRTPIEDVLPVSMEIRQEQRRFGLAMAIALDRSGSMSMPVGGGRTKMDLANLGACAALDLLGPIDSLAVIAVDSSAHVVVPLTRVTDRGPLATKIRKIESQGGGIFTNTAIRAASSQLLKAPQGTKHIVIFADAADAEEPGDYKTLVPKLARAGVTLSVIGLGGPTDSDAAFLRDLAKRGRGRCFFVSSPKELPRVFAQETIQVARSSLVTERTGVAVRSAIHTVGALRGAAFPDVDGYSIAYLKPDADRGLVTRDDNAAPMLSFWQCGLGRSAAFLGEADGKLSGGLRTWDEYAEFFSTLVRWTAGTEASDEVFARVTRTGHEARLEVEVDEDREDLLGGIEARVLGPDGKARDVFLERSNRTRLEARIPLEGEGVYRPVLRLADGRFMRLPAMTLPYSPEFEPRTDPEEGERALRRLVRIAEGRLNPPTGELMAGSRESLGLTPLARPLAVIAVLLLLAEIAIRRLGIPSSLWPRLRRRLPKLPRISLRSRVRRKRRRRPSSPDPEGPQPEAVESPPERPDVPPTDGGITSVLDRARERRRRRR